MMHILPLRERPGVIEQLARWHHAQWGGMNPDSAIERRMTRLRNHLEPGRVPQTFIAVDGKELLGSASLVVADLDTHEHLSPWLAAVYVDPPHRERGVGSALVQRVADEARLLGMPVIYLFTPDRAPFYARLGWQARALGDHACHRHGTAADRVLTGSARTFVISRRTRPRAAGS
jgi:predicted N-acetyltransferase YhbS